jgi:hypothetical protein
MDQPLSLSELRNAVTAVAGALVHHHAITDHQWDDAITTLQAAREQHGGPIRKLITQLFTAAPEGSEDRLPGVLDLLLAELEAAELWVALPTPTAPRGSTNRRKRASRKNTAGPPHQLTLSLAEGAPAPGRAARATSGPGSQARTDRRDPSS